MMLAQAGRNRKQPVTARNFVRERPVTDVVRFQTLAILHKDHLMSLDNFWSITTGYDVKYLLPIGIYKF